ncbi:hypothetical protein GOODEAATRI_024775 [Goodea atripinnis]|uniref:Uncharacterized protein n=1 Tax=Goodea atripinnis TaxID=208336 RepID=A0ABV0Q0T4_9TELE
MEESSYRWQESLTSFAGCESVRVDVLLTAANQCGDKFLQKLRPHLADLQNLIVVHLFFTAVVQRHLWSNR